MDIRPKLLSKATYKTLQGLGVVGRSHQDLPRVTAAAEVEEGSPIFPEFRVNYPTFSVIRDLESERALKMRLPNLVPMPHRTLLLNLHMTTDRIGLFHLSPVEINLRPTRRPMDHPMRLTTLRRPEEATNLLTMGPHSSGLAAEPVVTVTLGMGSAVLMGMVGLHNRHHNHRKKERIRVHGRESDNMGSLGGLRNSLILSDNLGSDLPP